MDKQKEISVKFLQWVKKNCTARTTSRNNIYAAYWQLAATGVLYTDEELFDYWFNIKGNA
jgi:hypothetical protein